MRAIVASGLIVAGLLLMASQWLKPVPQYQPIDFDVLSEYNRRVAIPARSIHDIPEPVFNELMGKRVRQTEKHLTEGRESANTEGLLGVCGAFIGGAGVWWLIRERRIRKGADGTKVAMAEVV